MSNKRTWWAGLLGLFLAIVLVGCGNDGSGSGAAGVYRHPEEGTITLEDGGRGTWEQEGNDEPASFTWKQDGDEITFTLGRKEGRVRLVNGDLVLPPDMISGDEDVTFTSA